MNRVLQEIIDILSIDRIEENLFRGQNHKTEHVFGGQVLAQAIAAAQADAERVRLQGEAEATVILKQGEAEAAALEMRAEAYRHFNDAAVLATILRDLPNTVRAAAEPIGQIDNLTVLSTDGASEIVRTTTSNLTQASAAIENLTGINMANVFTNALTIKDDVARALLREVELYTEDYARAHAGLCLTLLEEYWMSDEERALKDAGRACGQARQLATPKRHHRDRCCAAGVWGNVGAGVGTAPAVQETPEGKGIPRAGRLPRTTPSPPCARASRTAFVSRGLR